MPKIHVIPKLSSRNKPELHDVFGASFVYAGRTLPGPTHQTNIRARHKHVSAGITAVDKMLSGDCVVCVCAL